MRLYFVELETRAHEYGTGALLVTANDERHAEGVADEWLLAHGKRAQLKVKEVREVQFAPFEASVVDHVVYLE